MRPGPLFNIKTSSYQYRKSHCGDKTVVRSSYLHNGISYTGKMSSLYWIRALTVVTQAYEKWYLTNWIFVLFMAIFMVCSVTNFHFIWTTVVIFSCDQAALQMVFSVRLSVCPSHLFDYVPIIVSSWNFHELLPMTDVRSMQKVKVRGQRSRSQRSWPNLTVSGL